MSQQNRKRNNLLTKKNNIMNSTAQKTSLEDFNTSIEDLKNRLRNNEEIKQNHFGDYLMIEEEDGDEKYKVWLNHPENVSLGEPTAQIEYFGASNGYTWETIAEFNGEY